MNTAITDIDLVSLIEQKSGIRLSQKARHRLDGPEFWGSCPFCGGTDRFHVWPQAMRPHYWCRVCGKQGSIPWFLVEYCHMGYPQALAELGLEELQAQTNTFNADKDDIPCEEWRGRAESLVHVAQLQLKSQRGKDALAYLHARGLTDETIEACKLGYIPSGPDGKWIQEPFEKWGLEVNPKFPDKTVVTLYSGILIPWYVGDQIWKLEVRKLKTKPDDQNKIPSIKGSRDALYNINALQPGQTIVLCESAFDAMSGLQTCQDQATFLATGGTKQAQQHIWVECLKRADRVLLAFDNDSADVQGNKAGESAATYWRQQLTNATRAYPWAHDLNDMLQSKMDLHAWLKNEIASADLDTLPTPQATHQPEPVQPATPLQGAIKRHTVRMPHDKVVSILKSLQQQGIRLHAENGHVACDTPFSVSRNLNAFIADYERDVLTWLGVAEKTHKPMEQQPQTCCKCSAPAAHYSPSDYGYCTEHYLCAGGHVPIWQQHRNGFWYCTCVVDCTPDKSQLN